MSLENYEQKLSEGYYRVRKTWEDEESQIGQYRLLNSAMKKADENPGYYVFTPNGIKIYPETDEETKDEAKTTSDEAVAAVGASGEETQTDTQPGNENASGGESEVSSGDGIESEKADARTEAVPEDGYPNDGNTETIRYARANTLLNVRAGNSLDADKRAVIRKGTIVEVLQLCDNGWLRIKSDAASRGYAYVSNENGKYFSVGTSVYTVQPTDSLWKIAEKTLNSGQRYTELKTLNGLTSNVINVGMVLLIP